ncbi:MAG TPA: hypothetical protein VI386_31890 [Candidatus Sulfotelmatobacter sp.]
MERATPPPSLKSEQFAPCYHFPVPITDTTPAARAIQLDIHRSMSGEQRLLLAYEMSMFARELCQERIRREHPEWTEAQVARELLRLAFFPEPLPADLK